MATGCPLSAASRFFKSSDPCPTISFAWAALAASACGPRWIAWAFAPPELPAHAPSAIAAPTAQPATTALRARFGLGRAIALRTDRLGPSSRDRLRVAGAVAPSAHDE